MQHIILDPRLREDRYRLHRATEQAAGIDVRACIDEPLTLRPGAKELVPLGVALNIDDAWACALLMPRSGLAHKHGLTLSNSVGLIDSDYQGQVFASVYHTGCPDREYTIEPMERIGQLVFAPVFRVDLVEVAEFAPTERGTGGFGSSGAV
ncbi:dUTP diphosphatase [Halorhodospira halophila]|uniref:dUTP diphosphatase n=1 Tax=Halorhodospira TaxID=85108 RepID=UPI001EE90917|nr:dUTP diphosphatase [Halorhodospira halophila]MCG5542779.1 dUTP diphosphatase [Halorhodospira sp. 9628]